MSGCTNAVPILYLVAIYSHHNLEYSGFLYLPPGLYYPVFRDQSASGFIT